MSGGRLSGRTRSHLPATALASLLLVGALTSCGGGSLDVGDVEASGVASSAGGGTTVAVTVPTGTLDLAVAGPADQVGDLRAPDGGSLIRISTEFRDADVRQDVWAFAARAGHAQPIDLTVTVGGASYPVGVVRRGAPGTEGGEPVPADLVVAVGEHLGDLDDVSVDVGYDGLTQTVHLDDGSRDPGPADALYEDATDPSDLPTASCAHGPVRDGGLTALVTCRVGPVRALPYLPGPGWAADGHAWTVIGLGIDLPRAQSAPAAGTAAGTYAVSRVSDATTLSGEEPTDVLDETTGQQGARYAAQLVFDTTSGADGALRVALDYTLGLVDSRGRGSEPPARRDLRYATTVDLSTLGPA